MIRRFLSQKLEDSIKKLNNFNNIIVIEGARQVGKTSLVRSCLKKSSTPSIEVNLEEKRSLAGKIDDCKNFDELTNLLQLELNFSPEKKSILFIDEAQESQKLGTYVRFMKEKWEKTLVILTGSSLFQLFKENSRYPVGRTETYWLQPFNFEEFLLALQEEKSLELLKQGIKKREFSTVLHDKLLLLLNNYIEVGGLPEVVLSFHKKDKWKQIRENILYGYYNDFKRVFGEEKQNYLIAAFKATAILLGSPFKNTYVSELMGGGKNNEILSALSHLESWRLIQKVDQKGPKVESQFHPKRYLFDTGIAKELRELAKPTTSLAIETNHRNPLGGLIENKVAQSLAKDQLLENLAGWKKSSSGTEIDFIVKRKNQLIPIECKASLKLKASQLSGVKDFMMIYDSPYAITVSLAPYERRELLNKKQVINIPLYLIDRWEELLD